MANIVHAFTVEQTARLTQLSPVTLRAWGRKGFFVPAFPAGENGSPSDWLYSFEDVRSLRVLFALRKQCSLQHLRRVKVELETIQKVDWHRLHLYVLKRQVVIRHERDFSEVLSGQIVMDLPLEAVSSSLSEDLKKLSDRGPEQIGRLSKRRGVLQSSRVVAGTRISIGAIQRFSEAGYTVADILEEYPQLTEADIVAALQHREVA